MNTKQFDWIGKPSNIKKTLHSVSYTGTGTNTILFTLGEEGEITLKVETDMPYAFIFLHTDEEYIAFKKYTLVQKTPKNRFEIPVEAQPQSLRVVKEGPALTFYSADDKLLITQKEAYRGSASIGLVTEGCSRATLEVF